MEEKIIKTEEKIGKLEVVFILDRSGSMSGLEDDTIGGFNSTLRKQKAEPGEIIWSTVLFDDRHEVIHDRVPVDKVKELTGKEYYVRGCTALLDAIGRAVQHIKNVHKYLRPEDVPDRTLFVITTDGYENASREYTYDRVKQMIEEQTEKSGWQFLFLGANMDAVSVAGRMGINPNMSASFINDKGGIERNYRAINKTMEMMKFVTIPEDVDSLDEVKKYYRDRS